MIQNSAWPAYFQKIVCCNWNFSHDDKCTNLWWLIFTELMTWCSECNQGLGFKKATVALNLVKLRVVASLWGLLSGWGWFLLRRGVYNMSNCPIGCERVIFISEKSSWMALDFYCRLIISHNPGLTWCSLLFRVLSSSHETSSLN